MCTAISLQLLAEVRYPQRVLVTAAFSPNEVTPAAFREQLDRRSSEERELPQPQDDPEPSSEYLQADDWKIGVRDDRPCSP